MATMAFFVDFEEGHLFPTFRLARELRARGHRVCYFGAVDVEQKVRAQGFEFFALMESVLPRGSAQRLRAEAGYDPENESMMTAAQRIYFEPLVRGEVLDGIMAAVRPDLVLMLSFFYLEGLVIHFRYSTPVLFVVSYIRKESRAQAANSVIGRLLELSAGVSEFVEMLQASGVRLGGLNDIAQLILRMPELAVYPKSFDLVETDQQPECHHIGAGVDLNRAEEKFPWDELGAYERLIYFSLGSQADVFGALSTRLFRAVLAAAAERPRWQVIMSVSRAFNASDYSGVTPNVYACNWAPQLDVLTRADVMVTHGGLGTIKECVLSKVPMLVFPIMQDQRNCAKLVVQNGMGLRGDIANVSPDELIGLIETITSNGSFNAAVARMRERFLAEDNLALGLEIVEQASRGQ